METVKNSLLILVLLVLTSCVSPKKAQGDLPENPSNTETVIEFEQTRGECGQVCPLFVVTIYSDGRVVYDGKQTAKVLGRVESRLSDTDFAELLSKLRSISSLELSEKYTQRENCSDYLTDQPSSRLYFRLGDVSKTIYHYQGCLGSEEADKLREFEDHIRRVTAVDQLVN